MSVPSYVKNALFKFQHAPRSTTQHASYPWTRPTYGVKVQMMNDADTLAPLPPTAIKFLQRVIGKFIYYGCAVNSNNLAALRSLSAAQSQVNQVTMESLVWFLNYMATHLIVAVRFYASDMILTNHSDTSYLSETKARSQSGRNFLWATKPPTITCSRMELSSPFAKSCKM